MKMKILVLALSALSLNSYSYADTNQFAGFNATKNVIAGKLLILNSYSATNQLNQVVQTGIMPATMPAATLSQIDIPTIQTPIAGELTTINNVNLSQSKNQIDKILYLL